jgi:anti-sigma regulatory factor (Ser/Thr protein kinase)
MLINATLWPIITVPIETEGDVVVVRQRAHRVAEWLGFERQDQTRIATAVSELARNAFGYAGGGRAEFLLDAGVTPQRLCVRISDKGPGIADPRAEPRVDAKPGRAAPARGRKPTA